MAAAGAGGRPKPLFTIVLAVVVLGLIALGVSRIMGKGDDKNRDRPKADFSDVGAAGSDATAAGGVAAAADGDQAAESAVGGELEGVAVSSGAACSSGKVRSSRVLAAMGVAPELAKAALRVSFGHESKESDVEEALAALNKITARRAQGPAA